MKKNEYELKMYGTELQFWKGYREHFFIYESGICSHYDADFRWFNFEGFALDDVFIKPEGRIIGDE